jgi:alpha-beta hydrolase superfamily lysophospholipase/SAM-dependent methyltransferase
VDTLAQTAPAVAEAVSCENWFRGSGGVMLFYRAWLPPASDGAVTHAVLLLHRGHEHSGRLEELAHALVAPGTAVFGWDARGHGQSPGPRGDAESVSVYVRDLDAFASHVSTTQRIGLEKIAVVAHSVGAVVAAAWVHDYAPPIAALVLATPAFRVKLYVPFALPGLRLLQAARPHAFIRSYVGGRLLTHDREQARRYDADPLISRQISVRVLLDLSTTALRILADAGAIRTPTLVLAAGSDAVVRESPQRVFFERLSSPFKEMETLTGFSHAIFHERDRSHVFGRVRGFIERAFARPPERPDALLAADERGFTRGEYDALCRRLPIHSPRRASFAMQRLGMRTFLRLSEGVSLGWKTGFDSGESLDYIYQNLPRGTTPLGSFIDAQYLGAIGWRGIRERKRHLCELLDIAIRRTHDAGSPVRVLDPAAGAGRYLLETIQHFEVDRVPVTALLRDRSESALATGRARAEALGLPDKATFEIGDAFDEAALRALAFGPTVAVVSGLYELFPSNAPVLASLRGLYSALAPGGWLIYTNQPWHPQIEMIARVLSNREGAPWIMRRRTQAEMDALVRAAGFVKEQMEIDRWGIFTVSLARKP